MSDSKKTRGNRLRVVLAAAAVAGVLLAPATAAHAQSHAERPPTPAAAAGLSGAQARVPLPSTTTITSPKGQLKVLPVIGSVTVFVAGGSANKTGAVTVKELGKVIGQGAVNQAGKAVVQLDVPLRAGDHSLTAVYSGNDQTQPSQSPATLARVTFTDLTAGPFFEPVQLLATNRITNGYDAAGTVFKPTAFLDRQGIAAWLYRTVNGGGFPSPCLVKPAHDVPVGSPFCGEIRWMYLQGLTTGYAEDGVNNFHPGEPVQRDQALAFLFRLLEGKTGPCLGAQPFPDVPAANPLCNAIAWAAENEITGGFPDGKFHPTAPAERQAIAAFIYRAAGD